MTPKPRKLNPTPGVYVKDYAKMRTFFNTIKDYKDPKNNRQLSVIFNRLPSKIVSLPTVLFSQTGREYKREILFSGYYLIRPLLPGISGHK